MSKTYNDPTKQLWREKLNEFILKYYPDRLIRQNLRVACFPGAEQEGEEALEVKEVYFPLGIQLKNIIGIERDKKIAQRLRNANIGIEVIERDASDYFLHANPKPFDIISLDYKGQMTLQEAFTLEYIASRQLLSHHGILATNYFGSRESESMKKLLALRLMNMEKNLVFGKPLLNYGKTPDKYFVKELHNLPISQVLGNAAERIEDIIEKTEEEILREGITHEIIAIVTAGTMNRPLSRHLFLHEGLCEKVVSAVHEERQEMLDETLEQLCKLNGFSAKRNIALEKDLHPIKQAYARMRYENIVEELSAMISPLEAVSLIGTLINETQQGYMPKIVERYAYVSNTGCPMLADFFAFKPLPERLRLGVHGVITYKPNIHGGNFYLNHLHMDFNRLSGCIAKVTNDFVNFASIILCPRIDLVSEASKQQTEQTLLREPSQAEKAEIYGFIREGGATDIELCETYKITPRQLGSYKAWVTMQGKKND